MARIRIKHPRPREGQTKLQLLQIAAGQNIFLAGVHVANDALIAVTATEKDADKLLAKNTVDLLSAQDFNPIIPFEVRCHRSIICHHVDDLVYGNSEEDIKKEVTREQTWAKIIRVTKFPNRMWKANTFKIEMEESNMTEKAEQNGLLMFRMSITSHQIRREQYTPLLTCLKCYKIEDHNTKDCRTPPEYKICSECGNPGHTHRECTSQEKKCINCGENHRTMAMRCKIRKEAIKAKEEEKKAESSRTPHSYSTAAAKPIANEPNSSLLNSLSSDSPLTKYFVGMLHAHFLNSIEPGSYQRHFSEFAKLNKLQDVVWPENIPSQRILQNIMPSTTTPAVNEDETSDNNPSEATVNSSASLDTSTTSSVETSTSTSSVDSMAEVDIENMNSPTHQENLQQASKPNSKQKPPQNTQHTNSPTTLNTRANTRKTHTTPGPNKHNVPPKNKNHTT